MDKLYMQRFKQIYFHSLSVFILNIFSMCLWEICDINPISHSIPGCYFTQAKIYIIKGVAKKTWSFKFYNFSLCFLKENDRYPFLSLRILAF